MPEIRTRFAPSPTGYLHVGGARTALFAWLYARHFGGKFILRMEDTDRARSTEASVDMVLRDLRWLGLAWDEGPSEDGRGSVGPYAPYFQSQRLEIYAKYLEELKAKGLAYPTFESKEEVEAGREAAIASGQAPAQSFHEASAEEVAAKAEQGLKPAWRFRIPETGVTEFEDLIHGKMRFENKLMNDFVIVRSDGVPTYNFAAVVDDALMKITHVIRGDDHLSNTPRQVCLYRALALGEPAFAHIPMILGPDRQRLSKRHGASAVGEYEQQGYLPEALLNYLALLGWSFDATTTLFSLKELVEKFSLERVNTHAAIYDPAKLEWMNGVYVKAAPLERIAALAWPHFTAAGLLGEEAREAKWPWFLKLVASLKEKVRSLGQLPADTEFFFKETPATPEAKQKFAESKAPAWLPQFLPDLEAADFDPTTLEALCRAKAEPLGVKFKDVVAGLRCGVSGRTVTPGLFETMELLGKETCVRRLQQALKGGLDAAFVAAN